MTATAVGALAIILLGWLVRRAGVLQQVGEGRLIASVAARRLLGAMGLGAAVSEAGP